MDNPYQIWVVNRETYSRDNEPYGMSKSFPYAPRAIEYYEENKRLHGSKLWIELRHYYSPDEYAVLRRND